MSLYGHEVFSNGYGESDEEGEAPITTAQSSRIYDALSIAYDRTTKNIEYSKDRFAQRENEYRAEIEKARAAFDVDVRFLRAELERLDKLKESIRVVMSESNDLFKLG